MSTNPPDACLNRNRARTVHPKLQRHTTRFRLLRLRLNCRPVKIAIALCGYLASVWLSSSPVYALDPTKSVTQYMHTAWRTQDGSAPASMYSIAQTSDGFLWFLSSRGEIYRFDGVQFRPWQIPAEAKSIGRIRNIVSDRADGLWALGANGIAHLKGELVISQVALEGLMPNPANVSVDPDGSVWVVRGENGVTEPLCHVTEGAVKCFGKSDGIQIAPIDAILADGKAGFWLGGQAALAHWHAGVSEVYPIKGLSEGGGPGILNLASGPDGSVWLGIFGSGLGRGLARFEKGTITSFITPTFDGSKLAVFALRLDRDGNLWVGTASEGIFRVHGNVVDHYARAEGLSGDYVRAFFEDREGIVWAASTSGVDKFHDPRVTTFSAVEGLSKDLAAGVLAGRDGTVWVANGDYLDHIVAGSVSTIRSPGHGQVASLLEDHAGNLWVGVDDGLAIFQDGHFRRLAEPNHQALGLVSGLVEDSDGNIWAQCAAAKLIRIRDFKVQEELSREHVPAGRIASDPHGGIWVGTRKGELVHFREGTLQKFQVSSSANPFPNQIIGEVDGSVLAAFDDGLVELRQGKTQRMTTKNGLPCDTIYSFVQDQQKRWWLNTQCGVVEFSDSDLQQWRANPDAVIQTRLYDVLDGARPSARPAFNSATSSRDGRVWFVNSGVVQMLDPSRLLQKALPAQTYIESVVVDRKELIASGSVQLAPHPRDLQINYASPMFLIPQKVRFRYRLDGYEPDWHDAGTRRQAFYTDLPPGNYSFSVIACNSDGVWNNNPTTFHFSVTPALYQTKWFRLSLLILFLALLWAAYQLRARQLATQFNKTFEARVSERTRIARELHDTLLQSFQGLLLRFQSVAKLLPDRPAEARQRLDNAIQQAAEAITEGRDAVQGLRSSAFETNDLANAIAAIAEELTKDSAAGESPILDLEVEGAPRGLNPVVRDEAYRIACEALRNAVRHAQARRITVEIRYDKRYLRLRVRDDGKGIDQDPMQRQPSGHFGLPGMRERAETVGGRLEVWSKLNSGTQVELSIPGSIAYDGASHQSVTAEERPRSKPQ
jgi:signal transduction histidine kinase/ligand-binding sensor domain-containing protein